MDLGLKGKGVVVTGGSSGIGRAIALAFAEEGANVAICARGREQLDRTAAELSAKGVHVHAACCDMGDAASLDAFLDGASNALGAIDVLVNNASGMGLMIPDEDRAWQVSLDVDMLGAARASRKVIPGMAARGGGAIVHISSLAGRMHIGSVAGLTEGPSAGAATAYAAIKAALISHAKSLACAHGAQGIRVNTVVPGPIEWPGGSWDVIRNQLPAVYAAILSGIPAGRLGRPEEVADLVVYLASSRASWVNGTVVHADGAQYPGNT